MGWQNWVVSRMVRNQIKKPAKREPFDSIATRLHVKKRKMLSPVELLPDRRIVPADGVNGDGLTDEWIEPADPGLHNDAPIVLYLYDGGYFPCNPRIHCPVTIDLTTHAQARVCTPDYRLAPEHPSPTPVEDVLFTYRTLVTQGVSSSHIVVTGDSAGGELALALLVALRDAIDSLSVGTVLYSPWTDLAATNQGLINNNESDVIFRDAWVAHDVALYLGDSDTPTDRPLTSPLYANLTGLPILYCYVNTNEVLHDNTPRMAERTQAAGVSVSIEMGRQPPHMRSIFYPLLPEARVTLK